METIQAVLFDLDGTLVDTLGDLADATNEALRRRGFPAYPEEQYRQMVGNGARRLIERALGERCTPELTGQLLADFVRIYDEGCLRRTAPYPGIPEAVTALKERGLRLAVVTNKPEEQAGKIVRHFFGPHVFTCVVGGRPGRAAKPDPAAALEVLAALGVPPAAALFVGDSDVDMQTAHNAGMRSAGAVWGFRGEEELRRTGAGILLRKPVEIVNCC